MAVTLTNIEELVRNIIDDNLKTVKDLFYYSVSSIFILTESNDVTITAVYVNNQSTTNYTFDSTTNRITINDSLNVNDIIEIYYTVYINYSSTEIQNQIKAILPFFTIYQYKFFKVIVSTFYPEPNEEEKYLIALIASVYINPENVSISLKDFSLKVPNDKPKREIIKDLINEFKFSGGGIIENLPRDII